MLAPCQVRWGEGNPGRVDSGVYQGLVMCFFSVVSSLFLSGVMPSTQLFFSFHDVFLQANR